MLTIKDVHFVIQDISSKSINGNPPIHLLSLIPQLRATKNEINPFIGQLQKQGIIIMHPSLQDIFTLSDDAPKVENWIWSADIGSSYPYNPDFDERED